MVETLNLLGGTAAELRRDPVAAGAALIPLVGLGMWGDQGGEGAIRLTFFATSIVSFILQYGLTRRAMRAGGLLAVDAPGNVGAMFLLNLVSNLGILLGFLLLIVPGIWLSARWSAAVPILFAEEPRSSEAMAVSAVRTRPMLLPIVAAFAILYAPFLLALIASILLPEGELVSPAISLAINLALSISQIAGWYLAISIYRATRPEPVEAVFA